MKDYGQEIIKKLEIRSMQNAMDYLKTVPKNMMPDDLSEEVSGLLGRYRDFRRDVRQGVLDSRDKSVQEAQMRRALIDIAQMLSNLLKGEVVKVLFLAANPMDSGRLRLDVELREIEEGLRRSNHRDRYEIVAKHAVRSRDLLRALLDEETTLLHFSGHGVDGDQPEGGNTTLDWEALEEESFLSGYSGGIALEDNEGKTRIVRADQIGNLIGNFEQIQCIFLNACYSDSQAEAFLKHVDIVIGMNTAVPDKGAIEFATSFYDALASQPEPDYEKAFRIAKDALVMLEPDSAHIPVMRKR